MAHLGLKVADACALPIDSGSLDAVRAKRVFMHLADTAAVPAEVARGLRPGGRMAVLDHDWDTLVFAGDFATTRTITRGFADSLVDGTIARRMRPPMHGAGFATVTQEGITVLKTDGADWGWMAFTVAKTATEADMDHVLVDAWVAGQRDRIATDRFFLSVTHVLTCGVL